MTWSGLSKVQCDWPGCAKKVDFGRCRRHEDQWFNEMWNRKLDEAAREAAWNRDKEANAYWMQATVLVLDAEKHAQRLQVEADPLERQRLTHFLADIEKPLAIARQIDDAYGDLQTVKLLGPQLKAALAPQARDEPTSQQPEFPEAETMQQDGLRRAVDCLEAYRQENPENIVSIALGVEGRVLAALIHCSDVAMPMLRELAGDAIGLQLLTSFADGLDPKIPSVSRAIDIVVSRAGLRQAAVEDKGLTQLSIEEVHDLLFALAGLVNLMIDLTADFSEMPEEVAFEEFGRLCRQAGAS